MKCIALLMSLFSCGVGAADFLASQKSASALIRVVVVPERVEIMVREVHRLAATMRAAAQTTEDRFESTTRPEWHLLTGEQMDALQDYENQHHRKVDALLKPLSDELSEEIESKSPNRDRLRELYTALWFANAQLQHLTGESPWMDSAPMAHRRRIAYWRQRADLIESRVATYNYATTFSESEVEKFSKARRKDIEKQLRFVTPSTAFKVSTKVSATVFFRIYKWLGGDPGLGFGPTY